jgi:dynein intermediate chain 1
MPVVDVNFAPYSSTILACATLEKCIVYDLHVDKHGKRAEQKPTKQPKLTNLAFNPYEPTILIGDDHGGSTLIKLNNTLYKIERPKEFENITQNEYERMKMESILNL